VIRRFVALGVVLVLSQWVYLARPSMQSPTSPLVGVWTLNSDLSDKPPAAPDGGDRGRGGRGYGGRGGGGGRGGFRGGMGGGRGRGGFGPSGQRSPDDMRRMRDAIRDVMDAPATMTITVTDSMVIVTTGEGRTTRLATDGSKIKDESTGIERKSHWDGAKLVTEITGASQGKLIETYEVAADQPRLTVSLQFEGGNNNNRPPIKHVYDKES
jgi:hypothetical protein